MIYGNGFSGRIARVADLNRQCDEDRRVVDGPALIRRDRAIGARLPAGLTLLATIDQWLAALDPPPSGGGGQLARRLVLLEGVVISMALLLGAATISALFAYDGSGRINVLHFLSLFVGLQWFTLLLTLLLLLPDRVRRWLPGLDPLLQLFSLLHPARIAGLLLRLLPQQRGDRLRQLATNPLYGREWRLIRRWLLLRQSQLFAALFNLAALAAGFALVVVQDLAFGWSSTLAIEPEELHQGVVWLATPWGWLLPQAVPSIELIETTRFFRLDGASGVVDALQLGGWWPFLLLALAVYGLLPRLILLTLTSLRLRRVSEDAVSRHPDLPDLIDRLTSPLVETGVAEGGGSRGAGRVGAQPERARITSARPVALVAWACPELDQLSLTDTFPSLLPQERFDVGGCSTLEHDSEVIATIAQQLERSQIPDEQQTVVLLVKGWEPPIGELTDFVEELRAAIGPGPILRLLPVSRAVEATAAEWQEWSRYCSESDDPRLSLMRPSSGERHG